MKKSFDQAAAKARAEYIVTTLRTCHVDRGFQLNEELAKKFLKWFDTKIERAIPQDVLDFIEHSGQSHDWILCGDPKVMICRLAARPGGRANA
jgi:hypothetical protein